MTLLLLQQNKICNLFQIGDNLTKRLQNDLYIQQVKFKKIINKLGER